MGPAPRRCARSCRSKLSRAPSFRASIASVRRARACATSSGSSLGGGGCDPAGASVLIVVVVIVIIVVVDEPRASARTSQASHSAHCSAAYLLSKRQVNFVLCPPFSRDRHGVGACASGYSFLTPWKEVLFTWFLATRPTARTRPHDAASQCGSGARRWPPRSGGFCHCERLKTLISYQNLALF